MPNVRVWKLGKWRLIFSMSSLLRSSSESFSESSFSVVTGGGGVRVGASPLTAMSVGFEAPLLVETGKTSSHQNLCKKCQFDGGVGCRVYLGCRNRVGAKESNIVDCWSFFTDLDWIQISTVLFTVYLVDVAVESFFICPEVTRVYCSSSGKICGEDKGFLLSIYSHFFKTVDSPLEPCIFISFFHKHVITMRCRTWRKGRRRSLAIAWTPAQSALRWPIFRVCLPCQPRFFNF